LALPWLTLPTIEDESSSDNGLGAAIAIGWLPGVRSPVSTDRSFNTTR
jgi:hypothetical protein